MKKLTTLVLLCFSTSAISQECYLQDWEALKGLYLSSNGDNWTDTTGWSGIKNSIGPSVECPASGPYGVVLFESDFFEIEGRGRVSIQSVYEINLPDNNLAGQLDASIGDIPTLHYLRLNNNDLTGSIPEEIGNLEFLLELNLNHNTFTGSLPSEMNQLSVRKLYLSHNQFTGNPFNNLPNFFTLTEILLDHNLFAGDVIGLSNEDTALELVNLSHNNFFGTLPLSLANVNNIIDLDFSYTNISGCLANAFYKYCTILNPASHSKITDNNDIITNWSDFCMNQKGLCKGCNGDISFISSKDDFDRGKGTFLTSIEENITASNELTGDVNMTYDAGFVILEPGFKADTGTVFVAKTGGCGITD